jgi:tryptophan synthase beta chain
MPAARFSSRRRTARLLGIAISEAVEARRQAGREEMLLGSVLNHVLMHQTVIGIEALERSG